MLSRANLSGLSVKGYDLYERIGAGTFGAVYRSYQSTVGREVSVKVILPEYANQPDFIRRFEMEAQLVARLEHIHIVPLYDYWRDPEGAYLVMRWLRGGSLKGALQEGPYDLASAVKLIEQVCSGLSAAHRMDIIHRDLKPSNILFDEEGNAYLADFGIAFDLGQPIGSTLDGGVAAGSPSYFSPEQVRREPVSSRSDIYSLGVVLYELLTGEHPFKADTPAELVYQQLNDPLPAIEGLDAELQESVNAVIQRATAKDPDQRYKDVLGMAAAFRQAANLPENSSENRLVEMLTRREREILALIVAGRSNKQIAQDLFIELTTVKWYITQIYRKLNVHSRMQAILRARELQIVLPEAGDENGAGERRSKSTNTAQLTNPYKGLRAFEAADSRDFFGREVLTERLVGRLGENGELSHFLAVIGPSGSGKSSLVKAGLIPALRRGALPGSERWFILEMTPGERPLDELEVTLGRIAARQTRNIRDHLERDEEDLAHLANLILPQHGSQLLLVIDQFEELFSLARANERRRFLDLITGAVTAPNNRVRVVITLRADYYDRPLQYPEFGELVRQRMETVLPLSSEELQRAILHPAERAGVEFEAGLPALIIKDIYSQPGALPLLQYALTELFDQRTDGKLTHQAYRQIGGATGAVAQRAEQIYTQQNRGGKEAARLLFLRLVSMEDEGSSGGSAETQRREHRSTLLATANDPDLMDELVDTFAAYRLLSLDHDPGTRKPTVQLAHEAITREWERLRSWLDESREDLLQQRRLRALSREWQAANKNDGFLLREARLDQFTAWAESTSLKLAPDEAAFLRASQAARRARQAEEEARRQRELETAHRLAEAERKRADEQSQAARRLRRRAVFLGAALVAAIGLAFAAYLFFRQSEAQRRLAFTRELASEAVGNLGTDPELSIHLALRAVQLTYENDGSVLPVAEEALHRALQASRVVFTFPQSGGLAFSPDGAYLVIGGTDGSIGIWDARSGELIDSFAGHDEAVTSVAFSPDGSLLATASADYQLIVWDLSAPGQQVLNLHAPDDTTLTGGLGKVVFSPDGKLLLSSAQYQEARIWEVASGREVLHFDESAGPAASFNSDGRKVALMTAVWDISDALSESREHSNPEDGGPAIISWQERLFDFSGPLIEFRAPSSEIESVYQEPGSVSFSPDGTRLLATVVSSLALMLDANSGEEQFTLRGHTNIINNTAFAPNGEVVATASADGTARVWDAVSGQGLLVLDGHQDEVFQVAINPDGRYLATSSLDGTTKMWDITPGGVGERPGPTRHHGSVRLAFNPQTPHLATAGEGGTVNYIDIESGRMVYTFSHSQGDLTIPALSPDGSLLALGDKKGTIDLLDAFRGELSRSFQLDRILSAIAFSPNSELLVAGSEDGTLSILELSTGNILAEWIVQNGFVNDLAFNPDGTTLTITGADGDVSIADFDIILQARPIDEATQPIGRLPAKAILSSMPGHDDPIISLDTSKDGSKILTASFDGTAKVWDAVTGKNLLTLAGHQGRVWDAAFHPNGGRIATAGEDGAVILWDADSGEQLFTLSGQPEAVVDLAFSPDGKYLAASGMDGSVQVYVMPVEDLMALARDRLTRALSEDECHQYLHLASCP